MEKEPERQKSAEEELREKGYSIEKARLPEGEPIQCDKCMKENNFNFYNEGWFIEGSFYCSTDKEDALKILEEIQKEAERLKSERERVMEERSKKH